MLLFAGVLFAAGALSSRLAERTVGAFATGPRNETEGLLYSITPVTVDIRYRPKRVIDGATQLSGPARFTFTNTAGHPIQLAFPPQRVFQIRRNQYSEDAILPEFAAAKRIVMIPAKESVTFESGVGMTFFPDAESFLRGGLGWIGFVFERPSADEATGEFFVGTVFPRYSVEVTGE